jgi:hypothetical protein
VGSTYQGFLILHQTNDLHRFLIKVFINVIRQRGQNRVKILLGDRVVYHEHSLIGSSREEGLAPRSGGLGWAGAEGVSDLVSDRDHPLRH